MQQSMERDIHVQSGKTLGAEVLRIAEDTAITIRLEDDAMLDLTCIEVAPDDASVTITQRAVIGVHAKLHLRNITVGGGTVEHTLISEIRGEGSESSIDWIFYGRGRERFTLSARNVFAARNGSGEITMRGVAEEEAHVACRGMIEIGAGGGGTNTYLTQEVLMLDAKSKVDAVPGLEIKTNDVKASHSATVTKVSPEELFYLGSRGIDPEEGRRMIIEGFLHALLERIPSPEIREEIEEALARKYAVERKS